MQSCLWSGSRGTQINGSLFAYCPRSTFRTNFLRQHSFELTKSARGSKRRQILLASATGFDTASYQDKELRVRQLLYNKHWGKACIAAGKHQELQVGNDLLCAYFGTVLPTRLKLSIHHHKSIKDYSHINGWPLQTMSGCIACRVADEQLRPLLHSLCMQSSSIDIVLTHE